MPPEDDDDPAADWIDSKPTVLEAVPAFIREETTPPRPSDSLPGFELGLTQGRREGFVDGVAASMEALRAALVASKNSVSTAFALSQRVEATIKRPT